MKQYHFSIIFETVPFHHLFARCQVYDEHHAEFDQRTTHLKPISKEFCVQVPFQSPWHSQFLWRLMGVLSLRNLKMCWSQTNSEPSTAQQSWCCSNRLPEKMFRPFWNTWGMQLGLFHGFISMAITPTLGQNPQLVLYGQKVKHCNQIDPCPHRHSRFTISLILSCYHI